MKQKLLFLLTALMLLTTGNAWGGDVTVVKYSFDDSSSPSFTPGTRTSFDYSRTSVITDTKFLNAYNNVNGDPGEATISLGSTDLSEKTWTLEFEWAACGGCNSKPDHTTLKAGGTTLFDISGNSNWNTTVTLSYGESGNATLPVPGCDKSKRFGANVGDQYNTTTYWHHFVITGSAEDGVKLTVTNSNSGTKVVDDVTLSATNVSPTSIIIEPCCGGAIGMDELHLYYTSIVETVSVPSIEVAYSGENRTVTITPGVSSESNVVTTYYTLNGEDPTSSSNVYSTPLDIDADCTVKAISISSTSVASEIVSQAVTVGKLELVAPTFTKTGYADGKYTISMTSIQSGLAFPPASYTNYYSINGGNAVAYSAPFELNEGSTVIGYVVATNYTNSDEATLTSAVRPILSEVWSIDFAGQATEDKGGVTIGEAAFTASGVSFGNITSSGLTSNDNFGVKTGSAWLLRNNSRGLYSQNGSGTPVGVQGLKAGQYIKMVVDLTGLNVSDAASLVDEMSTVTEKYIVANSDGNANIHFDRYGYIKSISVCDVITPVQFAIIDCKRYDTSAAFATAIDAESFSSAAEVYAFNTSYHVTNGVLTDGVRDITGVIRNAQVNDADATDWDGAGTYSNNEQYTGAPDPYFIDNNGSTMWATQWIYGLPAGRYQVKVATRGDAENYNHIYISNGTEDIGRVQGTHVGNTGGELGNGWSWTYVPFTITETTNLIFGFYKDATNWAGCDDWHLYRIESVPATIGTNGFATFASEYPLDMTIANMPDGVRAFTASITGNTVSFTKLDQTVPENTGVLLASTEELKGQTVQIPVVASGSTVSSNAFVAGTGEVLVADDANYYFALNKNKSDLTFGKFDQTSVVINTNKAYFTVSKGVFSTPGARLILSFEEDGPTAISFAEQWGGAERTQLKDGKYLENGKIVIVKNGVKYGVNGQKLN